MIELHYLGKEIKVVLRLLLLGSHLVRLRLLPPGVGLCPPGPPPLPPYI